MPEISFNIGMISVDGVFGWDVEVDLVQIIGLSVIGEVVLSVIRKNNSEMTTCPYDFESAGSIVSWEHVVNSGSISDEALPCGVDVDG